MSTGVFDKEDFVDIKADDTNMQSQEESINKAAEMLNKTMSGSTTEIVSESEAKVAEISDEDEELAEQMLFKGYAQKDVVIPAFKKKGTYITVCTSTPQEISFVNELVFEQINSKRNEDGEILIPEIEISTMKSSYTAAVTFIGINGVDVCDDKATSKISVIKAAIRKYNEFISVGDLERAESLRASIIPTLSHRVQKIKMYPSPVLDFISDARYEFEQSMFAIMNSDAIIPK